MSNAMTKQKYTPHVVKVCTWSNSASWVVCEKSWYALSAMLCLLYFICHSLSLMLYLICFIWYALSTMLYLLSFICCFICFVLSAMLYLVCFICYALCAMLYLLCFICYDLSAMLYLQCFICYALSAMLYLLCIIRVIILLWTQEHTDWVTLSLLELIIAAKNPILIAIWKQMLWCPRSLSMTWTFERGVSQNKLFIQFKNSEISSSQTDNYLLRY